MKSETEINTDCSLDSVAVRRPIPALEYCPPSDPLNVLFADDNIVLLDKPAGLLSVPGKHSDHADCLEVRVRELFPTATMVHRLDMDTSGIMVVALNRSSHRHLGLQFERRKLEKTYLAHVLGCPNSDNGIIDAPLRCDWPNRPLQMIDHTLGRPAQTQWQVLERNREGVEGFGSSLLRLTPKTGRSHQLRVHLQSIGHPILGDRFYAPEPTIKAAPRLLLHSHKLSLYHPDGGEWLTFEAPCPF